MSQLAGFTRPADPIGADLGPRIAAATGLTITDATCTPTDVLVSGPGLNAGNKAAIQTFLNSYTYDPTFTMSVEQKALQAYSTLKQWAADADQANTDWPGLNAAQKDARTRITIQRLGVLCSNLADFLRLQGIN